MLYGHNFKPVTIQVDGKEFHKVFAEAGETTLVYVALDGETHPTLIHDVDLDPLTNLPRHVDFYAVTKGEKVTVNIPIEFIGESPAADVGANIVKVLHEIEIEVDPMNIPHNFTVDLSALAALNDQIHVRDISLPQGVELKTNPDEVVALAQEVAQEKEEAAAPADISTVEVEKKGKEDVPEEAGAE